MKPKPGIVPPIREPNGRHRRQPKGETMAQVRETVLSQPHRQGNTDQMLATAAGRFIFNQWPDEHRQTYYGACNAYEKLVIAWSKDKGVPVQVKLSYGSGEGPPLAVIAARHVEKVRTEMQLGSEKVKLLRRLIMDNTDPPSADWPAVKVAVHGLAVAMGHVSAREHPFR